MKIFLTGVSGFIGDRLARTLVNQGHEIHALVRKQLPVNQQCAGITYFEGDITSPGTIAAAMMGCEQVYHVAGYAKLWAKQRRTFFDINVTGTENVLNAAVSAGVRKLVYTSSCAVLGPSLKTPLTESDPRITAFNSDYDLSKYLAENTVRDYCRKGLDAVIVNPSRVYGPGLTTHANMITNMLRRCLKGQYVMMPGIPNVIGNYAYIDDVVNGHINAMKFGKAGEKYIVGGENLTYEAVIQIIKEELRTPRLIALPAVAIKFWGYIELMKYSLTGADPKFTPSAAGRYLQNAAVDCSKAINEINYPVTAFRQGIRNTIQHLNTLH